MKLLIVLLLLSLLSFSLSYNNNFYRISSISSSCNRIIGFNNRNRNNNNNYNNRNDITKLRF